MVFSLSEYTGLGPEQFLICAGAVFLAGLVRGFAGFALSAILMASIVVIIPPVELIPVAYILEGVASAAMFRGGIKEADMSIVWVLAIGSAIGAPIGLYATTSISPEISKLVALIVVMGLTFAQLFRFTPKFLNSKPGLYGTGIFAGIVTGLASVGGMVVALYVLSSNASAKTIRGSLVMFLFIGMFTSLIYLLLYGLMDAQAARRGLVFSPVLLVGVYLGTFMFRPSLAVFYKQFCLILLIALSALGLLRMI
jgi:uncharacterized membrane protein YfcA